ncbi:MAG: sensor histidine kinase [Gammaproteobacteria bacterium]
MIFKNFLSLKPLIVVGVIAAIAPLITGAIYAAYGLREATTLSRKINAQVFEQTKTIGLLLQKASDVERKARLFILLSDPAVRQPYERESYETVRASFSQVLDELLKLGINNKIALLANELAEKENLIYQQIIDSESEENVKLPIDDAFQDLHESASNLSREFERYVEQTFDESRRLSQSLERELLTKGILLLLFSGLVIVTLLATLSRSIRQLDHSIRSLGSNDLEEPIEIKGTADLCELGECLERLRYRLLATETSQQRLMNNIAREIELPLTTIGNAIQRLKLTESWQNSYPQTEAMGQIDVDVGKLKALIEQLHRFSLFQFPADLTFEQIEMNTLLEGILTEQQKVLQAKSIKIKKSIRPVSINGVSIHLRAMVEQLLANAIQYSPTEGEIRITLRATNGNMELELEDDGPGISPDERPYVCEAFYRGKTAANHKTANHSGLGLTLVREYVNYHLGTIEITDTGLDRPGTCVRVKLPLTN